MKQRRITHFLRDSMILIGLVCVATFAFLAFYIREQNEKTIDRVGAAYMASMNDRVTKHFSTMLDLRLTQLDTLVESIPNETREDSSVTREWMEYNGKIRGLESLAYYFDDGSFEMVYGDQIAYSKADSFLGAMKNGERKVSVGVDADGDQSAIIGIPFEVQLQDGRQSIAIIGQMPIEYISETLSLNDRDALLYSFVVRGDGTFVIRSAGAYRDNYFDRVRSVYTEVIGKESVEQYISELQDAINEERDYSAMFVMNGERRQMYCSSLPSSEWFLITIMPYAVRCTVRVCHRRNGFLSL